VADQHPQVPISLSERRLGFWANVLRYRGFVAASIGREFQLRYRNSLLGASWTILNPLAMMLVYTLIFSQIMQVRMPGVDSPFAYSIFLLSGLLPWGLLMDIVSRGPCLFLDHANLLKKIQFPKLALLLIALGSSLVNFAIIFGLFLLFLALTGQFPGWIVLAVIPILLLQIVFAASLCLLLAVMNVFYRDVASITSIALQFGFWLTPIVYALQMVPARYQIYLIWNPLIPLFESYHSIFVGRHLPDWQSLFGAAFLTAILCLLAGYVFSRRNAEMVDEL
jgi:lipopolysaccharide transport system permease protein